jgi:glycosyltransferase involved in cell wall biosynthesis
MRIALVTETYPPEVNGVSRTLHHLVDGLVERGHDVQVVRPRRGRDDAPPADGSPQEWPLPGLPIPTYPELRFGLPVCGRLRRRWETAPPGVVHVATEGPLGWAAVHAARRIRVPVSSSFHTNFHSYSRHYGLGPLEKIAFCYLRALHNRTGCTFVPSEDVRLRLRDAGFRNVETLGRGVDTQLFAPERRDADLRASWCAFDGTPVAIYVGRLAPEKNIALVVAAYRAMRELRPDLRLVLVGDGPSRVALERLHPEIHFAGMRTGEDLARHYASGDLFLFASVTETFGNVITEAMASGLAVVAYDYAAAKEHIRYGRNGFVAVPGEDTSFIDTARRVARDPDVWSRVRRDARRTALGLSWGAIVDRFEARLRSLAGRERDPEE